MTRYGPGASGDSSSYLMGAQNLLAGHGFYRFSGGYELKPITGFPPAFSAVLAVVGIAFHDLYTASRLVNAFLMGANLFLAGWLIHRYTGSRVAATIGALLILSSSTQVGLHAWVMSEPLYIACSLIVFVCLTLYLEHGKTSLLVLGGVAAAVGILTRYAGLSMVAAGTVTVLVLGRGPMTTRLRDLIAFDGLSLIPFLLWTQRNAALAGTRVDRQLAFHAVDPTLVRLFLADISSWFVPHDLPLPTFARAGLAMLAALALLGGFAWLGLRFWTVWRSESKRIELTRPGGAAALPWVLALYLGAYGTVLAANSLLLDASTTNTAPARYLAPAFVAAVILLVCAAYDIGRNLRFRRGYVLAAAVYLALLLGYNLHDLWGMETHPFPYLGYTARRVTWAPTVSAINTYEKRGPVVSNNPEMVYILTGIPAYVRPISYDQYQEQQREDYQQQLADTKAVLDKGSVFVIFDQLESDDRRLIDDAGLVRIKQTANASFFAEPELILPSSR